jgi:hypothetical protein
MPFETIAVGTTPNDDTGDTLRAGGVKINSNFSKAVEGPASSTDGRFALFDGTDGKLLKVGTRLEADLVAGPASATGNTVAVFDGNSGKLLRDGTKLEASIVTGPASATDGRVAVFDGTGGKVLKNGTKVEANLVEGPASATSGRVAAFDGTTGKLIQNGLGDGTATAPSITFASDTNTGVFRAGTDILALATNGVERARIASNGKITASAGTHWVGTVAETATSAVVEFGSNANGRYIRYPDGTQICWHRGALVDHTSGLSSSTRLAGGWTFPIAFTAAASMSSFVSVPVHTAANFVGCTRTDIVVFGPSGGTSTEIAISVFFTGGVSTIDARIENMQVAAIGRWY